MQNLNGVYIYLYKLDYKLYISIQLHIYCFHTILNQILEYHSIF